MANPLNVFDVAGRAMSAQLMRLNTTASNLANAGAVSSTEADAYRSIKPVFKSSYDKATGMTTVDVQKVITAGNAPTKRHEPGHPMANQDGDVFVSAVDETQELVEMMETSRQYQNNVEVMNTAKSLVLDTLKLGK
ncbi:flagellar basal body rod protein FlgC [Sphingomonas sp. ID0503]|uniref:flagellar basal body rod protein FlgC n=1 Tax=Sphingomonas sp. ID0503 TaxID=3399691 RepID=UPI003AFB01E5